MTTNARTQDSPSVLVVDDSDLLRNILREELEAEGYRVSVAGDGEKALCLARDILPDVILLDIILPDMDGYEVCRELKSDAFTSQIPVLILSSRNELKDKLAGFEAGADDYLTKPFFTKELMARLRTNIRNRDSIETYRQVGDFYLQMLFGIGSAITSPFKVDDEINIMLRQAMVVVGADRGALLLSGPDGSLEVRGVEGFDREGPALGDRFRISDKLPQLGPDAESTAGIKTQAIRMYENLDRKTVFVPMVAKEKLVGGIELDVRLISSKVTAQQQKVLYALASQAAIFIENARLEREIRSMFLNIIVSLAGAVDAKDAYTHGHSLRVARMALLLGRMIDLPRDRMEPLLLSAILHDVGKIATPDHILKKPSPLSGEEYEIMKEHPVAGGRMLSHIPALKDVIPGIRHHHESWDGSGYPGGLQGDEIPLMGRIILIGDAFDAMTTDRIYRKALPVPTTLEELRKNSGKQFDPTLVAAAEEAYRLGKLTDGTSSTTPTIHELIDQIE